METRLEIIAVSGPTFDNKPKYPALRVVDFQVVGEPFDNGPGFFKVRRFLDACYGERCTRNFPGLLT